ncbi:retrovirus-related pol polyprotein from transposon TNT 1-94 [Tanacetum coccineum]
MLSAIPDRHLLSFHDATNAKTLWTAIKARFGGNEASKKMQKNLLKQQFETFTIGSREELDSAMCCYNDSGQPGLDKLEFDDLYNNLKCSTLKQSTVEPAHIPKGYTQATSSKVQTAPNCASHSDEIIYAMEEIDIRWQVAMITARIRKFMRKTGRPIDLKPKNGITFDKSKIECLTVAKLVIFPREFRFTNTHENRSNGRQEKRILAIEDSNSKHIEQDDWSMEFDAEHVHFGQDGLGDFDWSNKADDTPVSLALMAINSETILNSSDIQKKTVLNSENSETSFENKSPSSQNSVGQGSRKTGLGHKGGKLCYVCYSPNHLIKDCNLHERTFKQTQTHKPKGTQGSRDTRPVWNNIQRVNHSNFSRNSRYPHQRRSFIPSAVLTREGLKSTARPKLTRTVPSKSTANVVYQGTARPKVPHAVPSQSTGRPYYPRMDNTRPRTSSFSPSTRSSTTRTPHRPQRPKKIVKSIWVKKGSTVGSQAVLPQTVKESAMIKSNQTWRPKGAYLDSVNRDNGSYTLKQFEANRRITQVIKVVMWLFGNDSNRRKNLRKRNHQVNSTGLLARMIEEMNISEPLKLHYMDLFGTVSDRRVNRKVMTMEQSIKNQLMNDVLCKKGIKREYSIARTPQQNGVAERKNRTLIEAARTMLADSLLPIQFWAEAVNTACYVLNRVLVTKPQMKTPYEILMGRSPNISFMRPFGCPLTILNTLDHLGKFDGKSEEGYLLGYSTNSKGFRVYNRVTRKVQDCLHVNFLENQENQKGKGPDWIFDDQAVLFHGGSPPPPSINPVQNKQHTADKEVPLSSDEQALHDELNKDRVNEVLYQEQSTSIAQDGCQKCNSYMATSHKIGNVKQPPGFEDPAHPNKVYIVVKALYGLHQAPRAWNERLSTFLLKHGYKRGAIDKTLSSMVIDFEDLMQKRIQDGGVNILEEDWFLAMQETNDYAISSTEAEYVGSSSFVPQFLDAKLTT